MKQNKMSSTTLVSKIMFLFVILVNFGPSTLQAQTWNTVGSTGANDWVYATTVYNGNLIVAGNFTSIGGVAANHIARWDGTSWYPLGLGVNGKVLALGVFQGELYVGGEFTMAGGMQLNYIAKWNGTQWLNDLGDMQNFVTSFAVYNNKLYVGGYFTNADGTAANYIARCSGSSWSTVGSGLGGTQGQVMALTVYNNELIAGGFFTTAGGNAAAHIAKWNGTTWSALGTGISNVVYSLTTYTNKLIAGGLFTTAGGVSANNIASWNGSTWSALGSGMIGPYYQYVLALGNYNGNLIAGGYFTNSNGVLTNGIANWNGTTWSALGNGLFNPSNAFGTHAICTYGSDLIVGGLFNTAGSVNVNHLAKWNTPPSVISISGTITNASCASSSNGAVNITVTGGTPPYSFMWNNGTTTEDISGLAPGTYSVTVTDNAANVNATSFTIGNTYSISTPSILPSGNITFCAGSPVTLTTGNYTSYLWSNGATTSSIIPTTSGTYSVQVTNSNGCIATSSNKTVTINPAPTPIINASGATTFCNGNSVNLSTGTYNSYLWSNGLTTSSINATTTGNYTVQVTNATGCVGTSPAKSVVVNPLPVPVISASGPTTFCNGGSVTFSSIGYSSYLWSNGLNTPSINATTSGNYAVQVTNANGCIGSSSPISVVTSNCNSILNLTLFIQGYYIGNNSMTPVMLNEGYPNAIATDVDDIIVELRDASDPLIIVATDTARLHTDGTCTCVFPPLSGNYYIVVRHRNLIQTWSSQAVSFATGTVNYNFSNAATKALGDNMIQMGTGVWALYSGDIYQDLAIDATDFIYLDIDIQNFEYGYILTDLNGDGATDATDFLFLDMNIQNFVGSVVLP